MKNREIIKYGNSWCVRLAPIDVLDYQLKEGEVIDMESALLLHIEKHQTLLKEKLKIKPKGGNTK